MRFYINSMATAVSICNLIFIFVVYNFTIITLEQNITIHKWLIGYVLCLCCDSKVLKLFGSLLYLEIIYYWVCYWSLEHSIIVLWAWLLIVREMNRKGVGLTITKKNSFNENRFILKPENKSSSTKKLKLTTSKANSRISPNLSLI